jgi:hypothetical protein
MAVDINRRIREILPKEESMLFGQLDVYPPKVSFSSQNKNEKVFIMVRQHVITNFGWAFRVVLLVVLPILISLIIDLFALQFPENFPNGIRMRDFLPDSVWLVLALIYYGSIFTYGLAKLIDWYFDIYLVTSERIIHTEFQILKGKIVSEAPLRNIQDVSQKIIGFFPSIFNYGDVIVQTAAEKGKFYFKSVPDPTWFRNVISDLAKVLEGGSV